jgi:hypothetical protein
MLNDLRKFDNLGTPTYFFGLCKEIANNDKISWRLPDLREFFFNKLVDGRSNFDGCLVLAFKIELFKIVDSYVQVNDKVIPFLNSQKQFSDKFIELLLFYLATDNSVFEIFSSRHLSYDVVYKSTQINNTAFSFKYSSFKQLLIDFEIIFSHPTPQIKAYILNQRYKKLFDKTILTEVKKRKVGIEEYKKQIQQQQIYGEEAEKFVVEFENKRLNNNKLVDWVAEYIVNEGYDVASYDSEIDMVYNRFIEVKSYEGETPYFFWSRNEYNVAKLKKDSYWLYLINRKELGNPFYVPIMVQNPYLNVIKSDLWKKEIDKYKIHLSTDS